MPARLLVKKDIISLARRNVELPCTYHVVKHVGIYAGGIDNIAGLKVSAVRYDKISVLCFSDFPCLCMKPEFHAVVRRILC